MGYAGKPENELAGVGVLPLLQLRDDLNKGLLEDIISKVMVTNHEHDVGE